MHNSSGELTQALQPQDPANAGVSGFRRRKAYQQTQELHLLAAPALTGAASPGRGSASTKPARQPLQYSGRFHPKNRIPICSSSHGSLPLRHGSLPLHCCPSTSGFISESRVAASVVSRQPAGRRVAKQRPEYERCPVQSHIPAGQAWHQPC
jgi:hypothetical protein